MTDWDDERPATKDDIDQAIFITCFCVLGSASTLLIMMDRWFWGVVFFLVAGLAFVCNSAVRGNETARRFLEGIGEVLD